MKRSLMLFALLAGCVQAKTPPLMGYERDHFDLARTAADVERACDLTEGALLHPNSDGNLEVWASPRVAVTYPQFSCVWAALGQETLKAQGVETIFIGEDAVD